MSLSSVQQFRQAGEFKINGFIFSKFSLSSYTCISACKERFIILACTLTDTDVVIRFEPTKWQRCNTTYKRDTIDIVRRKKCSPKMILFRRFFLFYFLSLLYWVKKSAVLFWGMLNEQGILDWCKIRKICQYVYEMPLSFLVLTAGTEWQRWVTEQAYKQ